MARKRGGGGVITLSPEELKGATPVADDVVTLTPAELQGASPVEEGPAYDILPRGPGPWRDKYVGASLRQPGEGPKPEAPPPPSEREAFLDTTGHTLRDPEGLSFETYENPGLTDEDRTRARGALAANYAGLAAGGAAGVALGAAAPAAGLFTRLASGVLAGGAGGAVQGGTEAALEGRPVAEGAAEGGSTGALVGGGMGAAGELAGGLSKFLRRDRWIGPYARAKAEGTYDRPDMQDIPKGSEGVEEASNRGLKRILRRDQQLGDEASREYHDDLNPPRYSGPQAPPPQPPAPPRALPPGPPAPRQLGPAPGPADFNVTPGGRAIPRGGPAPAVGDTTIPAERGAIPLGEADTALALLPDGTIGNGSLATPPVRGQYTPPGQARAPSSRQLGAGPEKPPIDVTAEAPGDYAAPKASPPPRARPPQGMQRPVDKNAMLDELEAARQANINPDNGLPHDETLDAVYEEAIRKVSASEKTTVGGVLGERRALKTKAGFGAPSPTDRQGATRDVYQTYRRGVRKAAPDVAAADDKYAARARQGERRRDILLNTEENVITRGGEHPEALPVEHADDLLTHGRPAGAAGELQATEPQLRVGKERAATTTLSRVGDTNDPGVRARRYIEELASQDPEFKAAIEDIRAVKAREGTRFGLPKLATNLRGATMPKVGILSQNLRWLGARGVDPAARGAQSLLGTPQLKLPLFRSLSRASREEDQ